ncbi:MAG: hypothetical protein EP349_01070 [Alphaproteobacteria bacterium]|nr:MAG: hypothetical protein EP349_01070 [Alphaproteobacteria bacterium]
MRSEEQIVLNLIKAEEFDAAKAVINQADKGGVPIDVNACDGIMLYYAHLRGGEDFVEFLLDKGAKLETFAARKVFEESARDGKENVVDMFLARPEAASFIKTIEYGAVSELKVIAGGHVTRENKVYKSIRDKIDAKMSENMEAFNREAAKHLQKKPKPRKRPRRTKQFRR